jgi:hypothetical protein
MSLQFELVYEQALTHLKQRSDLNSIINTQSEIIAYDNGSDVKVTDNKLQIPPYRKILKKVIKIYNDIFISFYYSFCNFCFL